VALILGIYLFQLWQPDRQVHLHSVHLAEALEEKDWQEVASFFAENYQDQWGHDRAIVLTKLQQVLHYAGNLRIDAQQTIASADGEEGKWIARIRIEADDNEVAAFIKAHVNALEEPFELQWRRQSWKPWDWKLVRVSNSALELPGGGF
jgi:RecB family endonuclease NucS